MGFGSHTVAYLSYEICRDIPDLVMAYGRKTTLGTRHGVIHSESIPAGAGVGYGLELPAIPEAHRISECTLV